MNNVYVTNCLLQRSLASLSFLVFLFIITFKTTTSFNVTTLSFAESYSPLFSDFNIKRSPDDRTARLLLNRFSGSGIISSDYYQYGFFSATIKMPSERTAGIVVAFYTSNVDTFQKKHDELDIEFLGNMKGRPWRFQTNMYGSGSVSRGREERYLMPFDPSKDSHRYSILWTPNNVIFYMDDIPVREIARKEEMGGDYPAKPMSVYATIWDASTWATNGGKAKVDYKYEPFIADFKDLVLEGCIVDPSEQIPSSNCTNQIASLIAKDYSTIKPQGRNSMNSFRERYMYYSYCYDTIRYPVPPPECVILHSERQLFTTAGRLRNKIKFGGNQSRHHRGRSTRRPNKSLGG